MNKALLRVGARDSRLSLLQAESACALLRERTGFPVELHPFSSPGDRDQQTDLRVSPGDFFTRDLDEALLGNTIDCAVHSAKDLPPEGLREGLDWIWLPLREDPTDCLVSRVDRPKRIGVSSGRRESWARKTFPDAELLPLRGTIPSRLAQLDAGNYDAIITATAALNRLGLADRITRTIPLSELPPPPGQGILALTFRRNDPRLRAVRNLFIKAVRFVGAGVGSADLCTRAGIKDLQTADCVIYDALLDPTLLQETQGETLYVGKRCGAHALTQPEITALIGERVRRGERVVRLKGGDPGIFGRLTEETSALIADGIPFCVRPGISALAAATTATGMLLTGREISRGFRVETPRSTGAITPDVYFMALGMAGEIGGRYPAGTPCAIIFDAGSPAQEIVRLTTDALTDIRDPRPGILLVGPCTGQGFPPLGPLAGKRVWITGSPDVAEKARTCVTDLGGIPVVQPLIRFEPTATVKIRPSKAYTHLIVTSPTAARLFLKQLVSPIYFIPKKLVVTGPGTAAIFNSFNIDTLMPEADFSAQGLLEMMPGDLTGAKMLRIRSEEAGPELAAALKARGAKVKDLPIYRTCPVEDPVVPPHDLVFLASASAAKAWLASGAPRQQHVLAMGNPTARVLRDAGIEPATVAPVQTVQEVFTAYARNTLR